MGMRIERQNGVQGSSAPALLDSGQAEAGPSNGHRRFHQHGTWDRHTLLAASRQSFGHGPLARHLTVLEIHADPVVNQ